MGRRVRLAVAPVALALGEFVRQDLSVGARVRIAGLRNRRIDAVWSVRALAEVVWWGGATQLGLGVGVHVLGLVPSGAGDIEPDRGLALGVRVGSVLRRRAGGALSVVAELAPSLFAGGEPVLEASVGLAWQAW